MNPPVEEITPPSGADGPTAFTGPAAREIAEATRYVRGMYKNSPEFTRRAARGGSSVVRVAVLSGSLANATTATSPTSQTATFYSMATGSLVSTGESATVYNDHDKTFASGSQVKVADVDDHWMVLDVTSCTALS